VTADLDWVHAIDDIPDTGLKVERAATETERQRVAQVLDLVACTKLMARYTIEPRGSGHFRLAGNVEAEVEQACVVTLEPLTNRIAESFTVDYWPETEIPAAKGGVVDVHDEPDLEPIVAGRLEVGRVIFESLAGAIDLFPRKPGATFESPSAEPAGDGAGRAEGPFAALARMKSKQ
jgi:hypothetical protein